MSRGYKINLLQANVTKRCMSMTKYTRHPSQKNIYIRHIFLIFKFLYNIQNFRLMYLILHFEGFPNQNKISLISVDLIY